MEDETDTSLQDAMNGSFERLVEYEKRRFMWKLACFFEWLLIAFIPCVYPFILNKWIPVQPVMDLFGLDMDRLGGIMACIYLVSLFFSLITAIFVLLFPPRTRTRGRSQWNDTIETTPTMEIPNCRLAARQADALRPQRQTRLILTRTDRLPTPLKSAHGGRISACITADGESDVDLVSEALP